MVVVFLSKARWGGIRHAVVRSPGVVIACRADARTQTPMCGHLRKGVGVSICTAEGFFPRDLSRGRMICWQRRKNILFYEFARKCAAGRAKLKNCPTQWHSLGEVACHFFGLLIDSHAWQGILRANAGGGWSTIVRGEEVKTTYFPRSKSCK